MTAEFAVYVQDDTGAMWKASVRDLDEAKRRAKDLTRSEGVEAFVCCLQPYEEIARFFPPRRAGLVAG
jgi:hypothetical protein